MRSDLVVIEVGCHLPCIAAFPQRLALDVTSLEPEFHDLVDAKGQPIQTLYSNKGL